MKKPISCIVGLLIAAAVSASALADEAADIASGTQCMKAKGLVKMFKKTEGMKPEKVDSVKIFAVMKLQAKNSGKLPERVFYRHDDVETEFRLDEKGDVVDFKKLGGLNKKGDLCMQDPLWASKDKDAIKETFSLSIGFDVGFINKTGRHSLEELIDGAKDGKSHYKKMFPGPMAVLVPKMTHIGVGVRKNDEEIRDMFPSVVALKNGAVVENLMIEKFGIMQVVSLENLQALGADTLTVSGDHYTLTPVPSIEKMKKFGFGTEDKDEDETSADED